MSRRARAGALLTRIRAALEADLEVTATVVSAMETDMVLDFKSKE